MMRVAACLLALSLVAAASGGGAAQAEANRAPRGKRLDDATVESLTHLLLQQAAVVQSLQSSMSAMQNSLHALQAKVEALESAAARTSKQVAFTVRFSQPTINVGTHNVFLFDTIVTNIGGGYNAHTGLFTAPVTGVYVFSLSLMGTNDHGELNVAVDKHGSTLAILYTEGRGDRYDQGSTEVSAHLTAGEQVWVRHNQGDTYVAGTWWTVFTGYLLQAD